MSYYYNVIKQGYEANGMDTSYLRAALERSVCSQHFDEFQEELEEDDLQDLMDRFDAIRSDDNAYTSFSGKSSGMDGNVKFVIETAAIDNDSDK